ncbi:MAG TPA: STAS domain-containing protein [Roseiflexaceae bacterium]|nr:STAS domain-containing protein [Roseiflexaceae bacterium]
MLWRRLHISARIMAGFGFILIVSAALAGFLIWRIGVLNAQIRESNVTVAAENNAGAILSNQVATTEQAIDRYLQLPISEHKLTADAELAKLKTLAAETAPQLSGEQRRRADLLAQRVGDYTKSFQALVLLNDLQKANWSAVDRALSQSNRSLAEAIDEHLADAQVDPTLVSSLTRCKTNLYLASSSLLRLVNDQQALAGTSTLDQMGRCKQTLETIAAADRQDEHPSVDRALASIASADTSVRAYIDGMQQLRERRALLLNQQGAQLENDAYDISYTALQTLAASGSGLEQEARRLSEVAVGVLIATLLLTLVLGAQMARAISLPLKGLVGATQRLQQGDYTPVVARDQSEVGQLATSFNQMALALQTERAALARQQTALQERNQTLEQAYTALHEANQARDQLAGVVRLLSVPVIPVLKGVIVLPLVGELDQERVETLLGRLSEGVITHQARLVILDVTGVPFVDAQTAVSLQQAAGAARLLGARCILVGISPEVAQALVSSGAGLSDFLTMADLRSATAFALRGGGGA